MSTIKVASKDGVLISYRSGGEGPPLVLVHGTGGTSARWSPVLSAFQEHFSVYALDRRGRGESGDAPEYSIDREFEDVAAVVDSLGEEVNLLGHSYGGICALEAALLTPNVRRLVLYEPPIPRTEGPAYPPGLIERVESFDAQGNLEEVVKVFMLEVLRSPLAEFESLRKSPAWADRLAAAHTLPRELRAHEAYRFDAERFRHLTVSTLLMLGGESSEYFKSATEQLHRALPRNRVVVLPRQRHLAMNSAPALFAREVTAFLEES